MHLWVFRRRPDDREMIRRPFRRIDVKPVWPHHVDRRHFLTLQARQVAVWHRREPNIGVETDLMRAVPREHRPAAWLRHVADENSRPMADGRPFPRKSSEKCKQPRMPPIAVAREPHHLS